MTDTQTAPTNDRRAELLARIKPANEIPGPFKAMIYGPKGARKTTFCCRARNCLLLDTENGRRSLLNHPELKDTPTLPVGSWNDLDEVGWAIREGDLTCETIIVDTTDKLSNDLASHLLDKAWAADNKRSRWHVSQAEYRVRNELFRRLTADWVGLNVNLIFTAHQTEVKDESDGRLFIRPALSDGMAESFGGYVELQGHLTLVEPEDEDGEDESWLQVHPSRRVDAKTRIGGLPRMIRNPNIQDLIDAHYNAEHARIINQKEGNK